MSSSFTASYENVSKIADYIRTLITIEPEIGIICGSGLGKLADGVKDPKVVPYTDIPNFPRTSVVGHSGNLVFGTLSGRKVVVMQGRFHMYEGYSKHEIAIPIRVMKLLGVKTLLVSNAAGGLNRNLKHGDFVILKDHIYLAGLSLNNVLVGHNDDVFGPRFPALSDAYNSDLRKLALQVAKEENFQNLVHEGVYVMNGGPNYETPAECKMLLMMGCDVVGMSTIPEVVFARHCGMKVFAVSLVTNISILDVESKMIANHEEVLETSAKRAVLLQSWFEKIIARLPEH
ncbi:unnamed protein product [Heterobilharzia americana]|nr:unnamed protein product [Heterobilharzia americana]CAH8287191.1 unnamed protein product [Heterobilharzia americana]CAH8438015.1 unnamed protein product [Heterobilharzia americana]CAH8438031.1 unnamed protein product [Heterobilharzia americana]